tara:strand:+ start:92 stop:1477 length:1386 start_codon:yes stop_codon:yes gene_type:complete
MPITLRNIKGSELTFNEVDNNFKSYFYTASLDGNILKLTYFTPPSDISQEIDLTSIAGGDTGSFFIDATVNDNKITFTRGDGTPLSITVNINTGSFIDNVVTTGNKINYQRADGTNFTQTVNIFPFTGSAVITGSLEVTGSLKVTENLFISASENSNVPNIALYDTASGELFYTASSAVGGGGGGSGATLSQELQPNLTVGGVDPSDTFAQGSTIEALLRTMLITYQEPSISNLVIKAQDGSIIPTGIRDVGAFFECSIATFNAGVDSPNGDFPQSSSLSCTGADIGPFTFDGPDDVQATNFINFGNKTISRATANGSVSFTVTTDSRTTGDTQSTGASFSFQWRNYLAASSTVISSDADLQNVLDNDVVQSPFDTNRAWTATCNADNNDVNNFTYIIYPASYGNLTKIDQGGILPVLGAFNNAPIGDFTANNNQGSSQNWRVYKTNSPGAFSAGVTLAIG